MKLIMELEGAPFIKPRINDSGMITIGYLATSMLMVKMYFQIQNIMNGLGMEENMQTEQRQEKN